MTLKPAAAKKKLFGPSWFKIPNKINNKFVLSQPHAWCKWENITYKPLLLTSENQVFEESLRHVFQPILPCLLKSRLTCEFDDLDEFDQRLSKSVPYCDHHSKPNECTTKVRFNFNFFLGWKGNKCENYTIVQINDTNLPGVWYLK